MTSRTLGYPIKPFLLAMVFVACVPRAGAESRSEPLASEVATDPRSLSSTERDDGADPQEVVVTGSRVEPGLVVPYEDMQHVHDSRAKGACLYKQRKYDEAFPTFRLRPSADSSSPRPG